jgi:hypothetical protein
MTAFVRAGCGEDEEETDDELECDRLQSEISFDFFFPDLTPCVILSVTSTNLISISLLYPQQNKPALAHCAHRGLDSLHYGSKKTISRRLVFLVDSLFGREQSYQDIL